ncbi:MAG: hypothetical protein MJ237_05595 [bacterium]|nr:hypothetical protein [bacterium]
MDNHKMAQLYCEDCFNQIFYLKSILQLTKEACQEREFSSIYYSLQENNKILLSEERNHYINMLKMAQERLGELENISSRLEYLIYNNTPTIAADK